MNDELKRRILVALRAHSHAPMHDSVLRAACHFGMHPTEGDITAALDALEKGAFILGLTEELIGRHWSLTPAGAAKAAQLG